MRDDLWGVVSSTAPGAVEVMLNGAQIRVPFRDESYSLAEGDTVWLRYVGDYLMVGGKVVAS
jgi:hypothetical protein